MQTNYFFLIFSPAWLLVSFLFYWPFFFKYIKEGKAKKIIPLRLFGAALFGGIPIMIILLLNYSPIDIIGLRFNFSEEPVLWGYSLLIGLLIAGFNYFASRNKKNLDEFPQIRDKEWSSKLLFYNILSWSVYLVGYEFLFRGLMLFPLVPILGFWPAAIIGTVIYSLSHYPKSLMEAVGAIPFGIILAWIAWEAQSIWPSIMIHTCMAVSNSIFSLYHHPDIHLVKVNVPEN